MKMKINLGLLLVFLFVFGLESISQKVDSLDWAEKKMSVAYDAFGQEKWNTSEENALRVLAFADRQNQNNLIARASALLSELNRLQGRYLDAIEYSIIGMEHSKDEYASPFFANAMAQVRCLHEMEIWDRNVDLCDELIAKYESNISINEIASVYYFLAKALIGLDRSDLAYKEISSLINRGDFKNIDSPILKGEILEIEVDFLVQTGQFETAKKKCLELIVSQEVFSNMNFLAHLYQKLGDISADMKLYQEALFYYNKAITYAPQDDFRKCLIYLDRGQVYILANNLDLALIEVERSIEFAENENSVFLQSLGHGLIARINSEKGFLSFALVEAKKALEFAERINDLPLQLEIHELLRDLHKADQSSSEVKEEELICKQLKIKIFNELEQKQNKKAELVLRIRNKELTTISKLQSQRNERLLLNQQLSKAKEEQRYIELKLSKELALQNEVNAREKALNELRLLQTAHESDLQRLKIIELEKIKANEALRINELSNAQVEKEKNIEILRQNNENLTKADQIKQLELDQQNAQRFYGIIFTFILTAIVLILFYFLGSLQKKNRIIDTNSQEINRFNEELKEKNFEIVSGIEYASKFQEIIFPRESILNDQGLEGFVLHRALDLVSGDLPFVIKMQGYTYVAAVDCIGHGVSASMLSIMTYFNLNDIIKTGDFEDCSEILETLHQRLLNRKAQEDFKSIIVSVDVALIRIPHFEAKVQFAGANLPLVVKTQSGTEMIKGTPISIGESNSRKSIRFEHHDLKLNRGDELYIFSDGFFHQFGGQDLKQKLSKKRTLSFVQNLDMNNFKNRKEEVAQFFDQWKMDAPQTDDMVFIGVKIANSGAPLKFEFKGQVDESINAKMINELKQLVQTEISDKKSSNLMLMSIIELLDNALRYSINSTVEIQVRDLGDRLRLIVNNRAQAEDFEKLESAIQHYSGLSNPEIEDLYLSKMNHSAFNNRGGAGLGLLQLIRKGLRFEPIESEKINHNQVNFSLSANFKK